MKQKLFTLKMLANKIILLIIRDGFLLSMKKIISKLLTLPLLVLRSYFKYNSWHDSLYSKRGYAKKIVSYLNTRIVKNSVLEIGCGTGDILRRLNYIKKEGLDYEQEVLNALNFLIYIKNIGGKVYTKKFDFLSDVVIGKFDVIILCNWIHEIEPSLLESKIRTLFENNLNTNGEIIIDILENTDYKYNHSITYLTQNFNCSQIILGEFEWGRKIYSILKSKSNE
jgi:SAM-dependent methyltransferase